MSKKMSGKGGKLFLALFALPFAGVGVFMGWLAFSTISQCREAKAWDVTPCKIMSVELETHSDSDSTSYKCVAKYSYIVNGREYTSDRVSFSKGSDNIGSFQQDCVRDIKRGKKKNTMTCYVNPLEPHEAVVFPAVRWGMIGFYMIFVLTFGGVGFGLLIFGVFGLKVNKKEKKAKKDHPDKPWMWNSKWSDGTIKSSDKAGMIGAIIFSLFWNLISFPIAGMAFFDGYLNDGNKLALIALIFPAVGLLMIGWTVYAVKKYQKYGTSTLQLASVPGVIGGKLAGVIHVMVNIIPEDGFHLHLMCIHKYTTGSGKHRNTHEDTLWEDYQTLTTELLATDYSRTALPVLFAIPFDARESSIDTGDDGIIWRLEAKAKTPGIDFKTKFDVPVFKTDESSSDFVLDDSSVQQYVQDSTPDNLMQKHGLIFEETPAGFQYRFPAARQKGAALGMTIFFAIWTAAVVGMLKFGAPILFASIFGLVDLFVFWGVVDMWLVGSRIEIAHRTVTIWRGIFGVSAPKMFRRADIKDVVVSRGMKSGNSQYYTIKLAVSGGKKKVLGGYILGRKDAENIAAQIKTTISEE